MSINGLRYYGAVVKKSYAYINDRAQVIEVKDDVTSGADGITGTGLRGYLDSGLSARIGVEARVGTVWGRWNLDLADRSTVNAAISSQYVKRGNGVSVGTITQGEYVRFPDFSLSAPPKSCDPSMTLLCPSYTVERGQSLDLPPGEYLRVAVRGGGTLNVGSGFYQFAELTLEAGSVLQRTETNNDAKTWIFVYNDFDMRSNGMYFQGKILAAPETMLVGVTRGRWVFISDQFDATLIAPESEVNIDSASQHASLVGAVFANGLTLHQGGVIGFVRFTSPWVPTCTSGHTGCH
jgi:hypothetical protein